MPPELLASIEDDIVGVETQDAIDIVTVTGLGLGDLQLADRPPSFPQPAVPRLSHQETPEASASRILSRLSSPRLAALRLAARRCSRPPLRAGDAALAASEQRPAQAGQRRAVAA